MIIRKFTALLALAGSVLIISGFVALLPEKPSAEQFVEVVQANETNFGIGFLLFLLGTLWTSIGVLLSDEEPRPVAGAEATTAAEASSGDMSATEVPVAADAPANVPADTPAPAIPPVAAETPVAAPPPAPAPIPVAAVVAPPASTPEPAPQPAPMPVFQPAPATVEAPQPAPVAAVADPASPPPAAYQILNLLQKEGRLIDFLMEDIEGVDDPDLGAAIRPIHEGLRRILQERLVVEPVLPGPEGEPVDLGEKVDTDAVKLVGNVPVSGPYKGVLIHRGWKLKECKLPELVSGWSGSVIAPAEVEIG